MLKVGDTVRILPNENTTRSKYGRITQITSDDECMVQEDGIYGISYLIYNHLLELAHNELNSRTEL